MASLVCDDHPLVRSALSLVVGDLTDRAVAGVGTFAEAWAHAEDNPDLDLCVVDLHMPGIGPIEGLAGLKARAPGAKFVVVTGSTQDDELMSALRLNVEGFVPKSVEPGVVEAALRLVLAGGHYLPARVAELARGADVEDDDEPVAASTETAASVDVGYGRISARHRDVLDQLARGRSNKEIARLLGLSPATIKTHVAHIIASFGAANRTEAAAQARAAGLV